MIQLFPSLAKKVLLIAVLLFAALLIVVNFDNSVYSNGLRHGSHLTDWIYVPTHIGHKEYTIVVEHYYSHTHP